MSKATANELARMYDEAYRKDNYFGCRPWLYRPYVKALVSLLRLPEGATVLDAGCGQGFFTGLFAQEGMSVFGVDLSPVGIEKAREAYPHLSGRFLVFDLMHPAEIPKVDCVFIRCCSLYDIQDFKDAESLTGNLLGLLKPGGALIFAYSSNLSRAGKSWFNHDFADVHKHFEQLLSSHELYFINKLDTLTLGRLAFNRLFTAINRLASKVTGRSGDIIVIARREHWTQAPGPAE